MSTFVSSLVDLFDAIPDGEGGVLEPLALACADRGAWRELFEVRLMQARLSAGLPVDAAAIPAEPKHLRDQLEQLYRDACVEAGEGLLAQRAWGDAWRFLNAAEQAERMRSALSVVTPAEEDAEELIEIALHEGANPERGFRWLLDRFGTCNAVTALDGMGGYLSPHDLRACVTTLTEWLTAELVENLKAHIERREGSPPAEADLTTLIADRAWLFEHEAAHVDASHLAATVRWSRVLESPQAIRAAAALADYGSRLHRSLQYAEAPPFEAVYASHLLFLGAQLAKRPDEAVEFFRAQAEANPHDPHAPACVEVYLLLLARLGRHGLALSELRRLADGATPFSPHLPKPLELARVSGDWRGYDELMRDREDIVGYAAGMIARRP